MIELLEKMIVGLRKQVEEKVSEMPLHKLVLLHSSTAEKRLSVGNY